MCEAENVWAERFRSLLLFLLLPFFFFCFFLFFFWHYSPWWKVVSSVLEASQQNVIFMGWVCQHHTQHPTWRTRLSFFVWVITFDLSGMGYATSSDATASIAVRVIWPRKPQHYVKVRVASGSSISIIRDDKNVCTTRKLESQIHIKRRKMDISLMLLIFMDFSFHTRIWRRGRYAYVWNKVISRSSVCRVVGSSALTWSVIERSVMLGRAVGSNRDTGPLLVLRKLWWYIEILYSREFLFIDFHVC